MSRAFLLLFLVLSGSTVAAAPAATVVQGVVSDQGGSVLPGASVELRSATGDIHFDTHTNRDGAFRFEGVPSGVFSLEVSLPNFSRLRRSNVQVEAGAKLTINVTLSLSLSADVVVTGKNSFDLGDVENGDNLIGVAHSATQGVVSGRCRDRTGP